MEIELTRSKDCEHNRLEYFIDVSINMSDKVGSYCTLRIDTGAPCTLIGMQALDDDAIEYVNRFGAVYNNRNITDVSGKTLKVIKLTVKTLAITADLKLENIELLFSPDLEGRAVLGMDILSLFEFKYIHEKRQLIGTFYLINVEKTLNYLHNRFVKKDETILPRSAMLIDDKKNNKPRLICTSKEKVGNKITRYTIHDKETGENRIVTAKELRKALKIHKIGNVTLTSDNKIRTSKSVKIINKEK